MSLGMMSLQGTLFCPPPSPSLPVLRAQGCPQGQDPDGEQPPPQAELCCLPP